MRITYRKKGNKEYWRDRWEAVAVDEPMENSEAYPLKYAELVAAAGSGPILEAGCGAGRILRYYHNKGYRIHGFDFIPDVIDKLKKADPTLSVSVDDSTKLSFPDGQFGSVLAFGLYHNLEKGLDEAIQETLRVLKPGGRVCASLRADNWQNRINDWLEEKKNPAGNCANRHFHKLNLSKQECVELFEKNGFCVDEVHFVENMPLLYKFAPFRASSHKKFDESRGRREGYLLSPAGRALTRMAQLLFPKQFCNLYVIIARKPS